MLEKSFRRQNDLVVKATERRVHTAEFEGHVYDVFALERFADALPMQAFSLVGESDGRITGLVESKYWMDSEGRHIGPRDLLDAYEACTGDFDKMKIEHPAWSAHIDKVRQADLTIPVLVYDDCVVDGMHRVTKALMLKLPSVPAKLFSQLPEQAIVR